MWVPFKRGDNKVCFDSWWSPHFSDFIKCVNVLFFHPGAILESKYIFKLNRKTIIKDTRLTFVKWLCAPERSAWKAHYELLCVISFGFRSSSTDTEILMERESVGTEKSFHKGDTQGFREQFRLCSVEGYTELWTTLLSCLRFISWALAKW